MAVTVEHRGEIAVVTIDNPPVNAAAHAVRAGLMDAVGTCDAHSATTAVVLRCAGRTFVAGADIREFDKPLQEPGLPEVVAAIEAAEKPWIAAIHGTALGGGLELALGCRARIAADDAKLGLPEVSLGLIPGAGGTARLPRLVKADVALHMIAGGKPVSAAEALAEGLVDGIAAGDLLEASLAFAKTDAASLSRTLDRDLPEDVDTEVFDRAAGKLVEKARGQLSIKAAVDAVRRALTLPANEALTGEPQTFLDLKASDQSAALRHVFFAERSTLKNQRLQTDHRPFDRIGVVGGGTMGSGIAAACLLAGLDVTMIERDMDAAEAGAARVAKILDQSAARGIISAEDRADVDRRFRAMRSYDSLDDVDLVIEAAFEDMAVKQEIFAKLDAMTRPNAVLATNTSYLDVNEIAESIADPSRLIGLHFFSPAHIMKLLEIVVPEPLADDVLATGAALAKRLRKIPVLAGVCDGFIGNRIMSAYRREADYLVEDGTLPWDVDAAMRDYGYGMGIFEMQDLAGLDIGYAARRRCAPARPASERYVDIGDHLCESGRLGRKTGRGWYDYADGKPRPDPAVEDLIRAEQQRKGITSSPVCPEVIMERLLSAMRAEAAKVLDEGIARKASDIDVVMINGYGFPRWRGGPMFETLAMNAKARNA